MDVPDVIIRLDRDEATMILGDLHRAAVRAALEIESQEAQGIASDLNAIHRLIADAVTDYDHAEV